MYTPDLYGNNCAESSSVYFSLIQVNKCSMESKVSKSKDGSRETLPIPEAIDEALHRNATVCNYTWKHFAPPLHFYPSALHLKNKKDILKQTNKKE